MKPINCAIIVVSFALSAACVPEQRPVGAASVPEVATVSTEQSQSGAEPHREQKTTRFGGWRRVRSAYDGQPQYEELVFVMLPETIAHPTKFVIVDAARGTLRCCLAIDAEPLNAEMLMVRFNLPGPWITDLTNGWNESSRFRPTVYRATAVDALANVDLILDPGDLPGGLVVEARNDLSLHGGRVKVAGADYSIQRQIDDLPDGDGAIETYRVTRRNPKQELLVEVPYGTY